MKCSTSDVDVTPSWLRSAMYWTPAAVRRLVTSWVVQYWPEVMGMGEEVFGVWCLVFGVWCLVFGVRCSVFGFRCSVFGVRCSPTGEGVARWLGRGLHLGRCWDWH